MQPCIYPMPKQDRSATVRACSRLASAKLLQGGGLLSLTLSAVFCLLACIATYLFFDVLCLVLSAYTALGFGWLCAIAATAVALVVLLLILPLFVGRVRLAGLLAMGEEAALGELFYYFKAPARFWRGLLLSLCYLFSFLIPVSLGVGAFVGSYLLYDHVFYVNLPDPAAIALFVFFCLLSVAFFLLCIYFSCLHFSLVALMVGGTRRTLPTALGRAVRIGWRYRHVIWRFFWRSFLRLLLSVCTLFVLWLLYDAHHTTLTYWELVIALDGAYESEKPQNQGEDYEEFC